MTVQQIIEILYGDVDIRDEFGKTVFAGAPSRVPKVLMDKEVVYLMPVGAMLVMDIKI